MALITKMNKNLKKALKGLSREQLQERMNYVIFSTGRKTVLDWIDDVFFSFKVYCDTN